MNTPHSNLSISRTVSKTGATLVIEETFVPEHGYIVKEEGSVKYQGPSIDVARKIFEVLKNLEV